MDATGTSAYRDTGITLERTQLLELENLFLKVQLKQHEFQSMQRDLEMRVAQAIMAQGITANLAQYRVNFLTGTLETSLPLAPRNGEASGSLPHAWKESPSAGHSLTE